MGLLLAALGACAEPPSTSGTSDKDPVAADCPTDTGGGHPTWPGFAEGFFASQCDACHSATAPDRFGAPEAVTFDTEAEVVAQSAAIRRTVLDDATMPPGGGVLEAERSQLAAYLDCLPP